MRREEQIAQQIAKYGNTEHTIYRLYLYTISHKQLIISVASTHGDTSELHYLRFMGVEYLQLLPRWEKSPLIMASPEECSAFAQSVGADSSFDYFLFQARLPNLSCQVLCATFQIQETPDL